MDGAAEECEGRKRVLLFAQAVDTHLVGTHEGAARWPSCPDSADSCALTCADLQTLADARDNLKPLTAVFVKSEA